MELELGTALRAHGDQAGVVGTGADLGEPHVVAADEQLHAEDAAATERAGDAGGDGAGVVQRDLRHRHRLPRLDVIAVDLAVADGLAEPRRRLAGGGIDGTDGEQRDLVVEVDETLDDDAPRGHAAAAHGVIPRGADVLPGPHGGLALAGRAHHRLDHARQADLLDGRGELLPRRGEAVARRRQADLLGGQAADALAVHGQLRGAGRRDHGYVAGGLQLDERIGGQRLDLRHDEVGANLGDEVLHGLRVGHVQLVPEMRHLMRRGVGVAVGGVDLDAETLERDGHFLAQFTRSQQQNSRGALRVRGADGCGGEHWISSVVGRRGESRQLHPRRSTRSNSACTSAGSTCLTTPTSRPAPAPPVGSTAPRSPATARRFVASTPKSTVPQATIAAKRSWTCAR